MLVKKSKKKSKSHQLSERQQNIYEFLKDNPVAVLSTASKQGRPHGTVIYFYINPNFEIFFITKDHTNKYQNIITNNQVMLTVFNASTQTVCLIEGSTKTVNKQSEINQTINQIVQNSLKTTSADILPVSKLEGEYITLKIHPENIKFSVYARPKPLNQDELFESIGWYELKSSHLPLKP